jgi:hypothetical protein
VIELVGMGMCGFCESEGSCQAGKGGVVASGEKWREVNGLKGTKTGWNPRELSILGHDRRMGTPSQEILFGLVAGVFPEVDFPGT